MNEVKTFLQGKKKILTAVLGVISGLAIVFGIDQTEASVVSGAIVAVGSVISYLIAEGRIDVERIQQAANAVNDVIEVLGTEEAKVVEGFKAEGAEE